MSDYWQKLKDPRWQAMRLRIMERDKFSCRDCKDEKSTLNVHHAFYRKGRDPWEYDESDLITLCETCHENRHDSKEYILSALADISGATQKRIAGAIHSIISVTPDEILDIVVRDWCAAADWRDLTLEAGRRADAVFAIEQKTEALVAKAE